MPPANPPAPRSPSPRAAAPASRRCRSSMRARGCSCFSSARRHGERAVDLLPGIVQAALDALPIPRRMHWGSGTALFVRPVHWIVMLYGTRCGAGDAARRAGRPSHARPSLPRAPSRFASRAPAPTRRRLRERGHVLADFEARRERIRAEVAALAASLNGHALIGEALLDEVTALIEWPVALAGSLRGALPGAAARGADLDPRGSPALLPGRGCAGAAAARVRHGEQHREPRSGEGARGQRARGAPAAGRCRLLLGAGPQAATRRARAPRSIP